MHGDHKHAVSAAMPESLSGGNRRRSMRDAVPELLSATTVPNDHRQVHAEHPADLQPGESV